MFQVKIWVQHSQEASIQHHTPSPDLEPAGGEEERPASQQLEARHWSRAETAGDQLDWTGQSSPEQSAMVRGRRWPMLYRERWAQVSKYTHTHTHTHTHPHTYKRSLSLSLPLSPDKKLTAAYPQDDVSSPDNRGQVEDQQLARLIELAVLHFRQVHLAVHFLKHIGQCRPCYPIYHSCQPLGCKSDNPAAERWCGVCVEGWGGVEGWGEEGV